MYHFFKQSIFRKTFLLMLFAGFICTHLQGKHFSNGEDENVDNPTNLSELSDLIRNRIKQMMPSATIEDSNSSMELQMVTSVTSGDWNVASTWSTNTVPTATDDVVIANGHTVTVDNYSTNGATLTIESGATLDFINNGGFVGTGGIVNNGTVNLTSTTGSNHRFESNITNNGTWTWDGFNFISNSGLTFTNENGGNFNINSSFNLTNIDIVNKSGGQITKSGGTTQIIPTNFTNEAGGTVTINNAMDNALTISGSLSNNGTINVNGILNIAGTTHTLEGTGIDGTGTLNFTSNITITSTTGFSPGVTNVHQINSLIGAGGGVMTIPAGTTYTSDNFTTLNIEVVNNGEMDFIRTNTNTGFEHFIEQPLTNNNIVTWEAGRMRSNNEATLTNHGTFNINTVINEIQSGLKFVNKSGGQVIRAGTGDQLLTTEFVNESGGTITINSGVELSFNNVLNNVSTININGTLHFDGADPTLEGTGISGSGVLNISNNVDITSTTGFTLNVTTVNQLNTLNGLGGGVMTLPAGTTLNIDDVTTTNIEILNNGTIFFIRTNLNTSFSHNVEQNITNHGTVTWNAGRIASTNEASLINHGIFNIHTIINEIHSGLKFVNKSGGQVIRAGTGDQLLTSEFVNESGAILTINSGVELSFNNVLNNVSTINVNGTLHFDGADPTLEGTGISGTGVLNITSNVDITSTTGFTLGVTTVNQLNTLNGLGGGVMTIAVGTTFAIDNVTNTNIEIVNDGTISFIRTNPNTSFTHNVEQNITNNGTVTWNAGKMASTNGASLINHGIFNINTIINEIHSGLKFVNKSGGQVIRAGTGDQRLTTEFVNESGAILTINSGVELSFNNVLNNVSTINVNGTLHFEGGDPTLEGTGISGTGILNITSNVDITSTTGFTLGVTTVNQTSTLNGLGGGVMTIAAGTTLAIDNVTNTNIEIVNDGTISFIRTNPNTSFTHNVEQNITNNGTVTWNAGKMASTNGASLINHGIFNINTIINETHSGLNITNKNGGQIFRTGIGDQTWTTDFVNEVGGSVVIAVGVGLITNSALNNSGDITVHGTLRLSGGTNTLEGDGIVGGGLLILNGNLTLNSVGGFTLGTANIQSFSSNISNPSNTALTVGPGSYWTIDAISTLNLEIINNGVIELIRTNPNTSFTNSFEADLTNNNTIIWTAGRLNSTAGVSFINYGYFFIETTGEVSNGINIVNKDFGVIYRNGSNNQTFASLTNEPQGQVFINDGAGLLFTDGLVNDGAIFIGNGTSGNLQLNFASTQAGLFVVDEGATFTLNQGNSATTTLTNPTLINEGTIAVNGSSSTLEFGGTTQQTIFGDGALGHFTVNNANGLVINDTQTSYFNGLATTILTLTAGNVFLPNGDLEVGSVVGGSSSSMVITPAEARLVQEVSNTAKTFPIGREAGSYNPVTLRETSGATTKYGARVQNQLRFPTNSFDRVERQWQIDAIMNVSGTPNAEVTLGWEASHEDSNGNFDNTNCHISSFNEPTYFWTASADAAASVNGNDYTRMVSGITTFNRPFGVASGSSMDGQVSCEDLDGDGQEDITCPQQFDNTPNIPNIDCDDLDPTVFDGALEICDGKDNDCDGMIDEEQSDNDNDGIADCTDPDDDNDGILDENDNCPYHPNIAQADGDGDGNGDVCDADFSCAVTPVFYVGERRGYGGTGGQLTSLDANGTRNVVTTLPKADGIVSKDENTVYVSQWNPSGTSVLEVNINTGVTTTIASLGGICQGMSLDAAGNNLYVTNEGLDIIHQIDLQNGNTVTDLITGLNRPADAMLNAAETHLYVSEYNYGQILRYELANIGAGPTIFVSGIGTPTDIYELANGDLLVAGNNGNVTRVDINDQSKTVITNLPGRPGAHGIAPFQGDDIVLVTDYAQGNIYEVDLTNQTKTLFSSGHQNPVFITRGTCVAAPCEVAITDVQTTAPACAGGSTGTATITATCSTCPNMAADLEYSTDGINYQSSNVIEGLEAGNFTAYVRVATYIACNTNQAFTINAGAGTDMTDPVLAGCPATSFSDELNLCGEYTLTAAILGVTATDNCDANVTISFSQDAFNAAGTTSITVTATDDASNTDNCTFDLILSTNANQFSITTGADDFDTEEETAITITATQLLSNDNASNSATLEIQEVSLTNPAHGTLVDNMDDTWTFTPANGFSGNAALTYIAKTSDASLYFDGTSHFYEFVTDVDVAWNVAKAGAEGRTLYGMQGYLATVTSQAENDFIQTKLQGEGWMGASDAAVEGEWRWVTGPEGLMENGQGMQFWQGNGSGMAVNGAYENWDEIRAIEPNNVFGGTEHYAHFFADGFWNDYPIQRSSPYVVQGYVVEYGGFDGCSPNLTESGAITIVVNSCDLTIDTQPTVQTVCPDDDVTFSVSASSSAGGLMYQWQKSITSNATAWTPYSTSTNSPSGFPNNTVYGIYEANGIIYAATAGGLAVLDVGNGATNWTVHNTATNNPSGFPVNEVREVFVANDIIYAATYGGGLATLDVGNGATSWTVYNTATANPSGFPDNNVRSVMEANGIIYVATEGGVATLDIANNATNWTVYTSATSNPSGLPHNYVYDVYADDGKIYAATAAGLGILDVANNATSWTAYTSGVDGFPSGNVGGVYASNGLVYATTFGTGGFVATLDAANNATNWTVYSSSTNNPSGFPASTPTGVFALNGVLYVATISGGIATLDIAGNAPSWVVYSPFEGPGNFPSVDVWNVYVSQGTIYAATTQGAATLDNGTTTMNIDQANASSYTFTPQNGDENNTYQVLITDQSGCEILSNAVSFSEEDTTNPVFSNCPSGNYNDVLNVCDEYFLTLEGIGASVSDDCDMDLTITYSQSTFTAAGTTTVTITAADDTPNQATCTFDLVLTENPEKYTVTAGADDFNTDFNVAITITEAQLIGNDNASNNATLEVQEVSLTNPAEGTLVDNMNGTWTFTPANGFSGNVALTYVVKSSDASLYNDGNSHYYEYIPDLNITWTAAKAAAEAKTLNGLTGYLATITSQSENEFIATKLEGNGWMGASDAAVEGEWRWVTGPEGEMENGAGLLFWSGDENGSAQNGLYTNWWVDNGTPKEPNNLGGNENYGHLITGFAPLGTWNDWPDDLTPLMDIDVQGYVVEYGGVDGCAPNFTATGAITIAVEACNISIDAISTTVETCPGTNDGTLMVTASCTSCTNGSADIEYSIDGTNFQPGNSFSGLTAGIYTVTVRDVNEPNCSASESSSNSTVSNYQVIVTKYGIGTNGYSGDGGPAVFAELNSPTDLILDAMGNIFFIDAGNHVIRKIDANTGTISTIAGTGNAGFSGNGGQATAAEFNFPRALVFDTNGDLYVADANNNQIRKINLTTGIVTAFAGTGASGSSGDGGPATSATIFFPAGMAFNSLGELFFTDSNNNLLRKVDVNGDMQLVQNGFFLPAQVAVDANDDIYVADFLNYQIKKIDGNTAQVSVVAGTGTSGYSGDGGLATAAELNLSQGNKMLIQPNGDIYFADTGNSVIRKIDGSTGIITTIVGTGTAGYSGDGGPATSAELSFPSSIAFATNGTLLIVDNNNHVIRGFEAYCCDISIFAASPIDVTCDGEMDGGISIGANCNSCVAAGTAMEYSVDGINFGSESFISGLGEGTYTVYVRDATFNACSVTETNITIGVTDYIAPSVVTQDYSLTLDGSGNGSIMLSDVFVSGDDNCTPAGNLVYNLETTDFSCQDLAGNGAMPCVQVSTIAGTATETGGVDDTGADARFNLIFNIVVAPNGNIYAADRQNHAIRQITPAGVVTTFAGTLGTSGYMDGTGSNALFNRPTGITADAAGNLYVADGSNFVIRKITPAGEVTTLAGTPGSSGSQNGPSATAQFSNMRGIVVDANGNIYITDTFNHTIRKIDTNGNVTTVAGMVGVGDVVDGFGDAARFNSPRDLTIDDEGNLYVVEQIGKVLRKVTPQGQVTTIAGQANTTGTTNGNGTNALFSFPTGIAIDANGILYIADDGSGQVRVVTPLGDVSTLVGQIGQFTAMDGLGSVAVLDPRGIAIDANGDIYIGDSQHTIRKVERIANCLSTNVTVTDEAGNVGSSLANITIANPGICDPGTDAFITTWKVEAGDLGITIPTNSNSTYSYMVNWGDGTIDNMTYTGDASYTYAEPGVYDVSITGTFPHFYLNDGAQAPKLTDIKQWGTQVWSSMNSTFAGAINMDYNAMDNPDLSSVTDCTKMFFKATAMGNPDLTGWTSISNVQIMSSMFAWSNFSGDISNWVLTNATHLDAMFERTSFEGDLSQWNTSTVLDMHNMFAQTDFNGDITGWTTSNVQNMEKMFYLNETFNQPIGGWDVFSVTNMDGMFNGASAFNQPLENWERTTPTTSTVANVESMDNMFKNATSFDQDLATWLTNSLNSMEGIFSGATAFNGDISTWNTTNVTTMRAAFNNASNFNQSLATWDVTGLVPGTSLWTTFGGCGMDLTNYDATLVAWEAQPVQNDIQVGAHGLTFCAGRFARGRLDTDHEWMFIGDDIDEMMCTDLPFIVTYETTNNDKKITFKAKFTELNGGSIDWGDGTLVTDIMSNSLSSYTHTYSPADPNTPETYEISITGVKQFQVTKNDIHQFRTVEQWGTNEWTSMEEMFKDVKNITINAIDYPDLTGVSSLSGMFQNVPNANFNNSLSNWDVREISDMSYMFDGATNFNEDIGRWEMYNPLSPLKPRKELSFMFRNARNFNQDIGSWDVRYTHYMAEMFLYARNFDQNLGNWMMRRYKECNEDSDFNRMLDYSGLSVDNFDKLLIGWEPIRGTMWGGNYGGEGLKYCAGEMALMNLAADPIFSVTFDGAEKDCNEFDSEGGSGDFDHLSDEDENDGVSLFPNPSGGLVNIYINDSSKNYKSVSVYNQLGELMTTRFIIEYTPIIQLDLKDDKFVSGLYTITLRMKDDVCTKKLMLVR